MEQPKTLIDRAVQKAYTQAFGTKPTVDITSSLEYCEPEHGDFACNASMKLVAELKQKPLQIAEKLAEELKKSPDIESVEVAGPGFINLRLTDEYWAAYAQSLSHDFGHAKLTKPQSVQLEFISANPTGPLVLTNAWAGYYGDVLGNIYAAQGYDVAREYYLNDGGNQIVALGKAIAQALGKKFEAEIAAELYRGEYINKVAELLVEEYGSPQRVLDLLEAKVGKRAAEVILERYIKADLDRLGVHFDTIFSEIIPNTKKTLQRLDKAGLVVQKDGATWLSGAKIGLDKDEVLVRSYDQGETYFLKDIAYQLNRLEDRGFDQAITIWGPDHHGQAIRLQKTLEALGHHNATQLHTQTIRLIEGGKEFKMSKRKGNYILLDDFLDEVPSEVARFYFAMRDTNSHMDFDLDVVREHSSKNPVYYALYAYARACSIEVKVQETGVEAAAQLSAAALTPTSRELVRQLSQIPELMEAITSHQRVHLLLHQVLDIARVFHEWYEKERVVGSPNAAEALKLIAQFKLAYAAVFAILGVTLQEKM